MRPVLSQRRKGAKLDSINSLKSELKTIGQSGFPSPLSCCIHKVPPNLRKMNQAAYTPMMVSIGPYHHGNKRLKSMEAVKLWFLHEFLERSKNKLFDHYVHVVREKEGKIRHCYSEIIPIESDEFVRMILTDACFIIEYFIQSVYENRRWHSKSWSIGNIGSDLLLIENQLPFFILKDIFDPTFPNGYNSEFRFEFVTFHYFHSDLFCNILPNQKLREKFTYQYFVQHHLPTLPDGTPQVYHLCDMLRICYVRSDQRGRNHSGRKMTPVYSACKLHDAGIKFEVNEDEMSLLKLQYSKGVLKIPEVIISDVTETLLRNVVAFEQCQFLSSRSMTDYIILLEYLIRIGKDVEILVEKGVIQNIVGGNDAVASMTKKLGRQTVYSDFNDDYITLFKDLNKFCDSSCNKYKAIFKQQYWSTPWRIASFLGAILLLFLTLVQTISSVIALFHK